jgi:hypothetical protein
MRRREFIAGLGGAAAWPLVVRAQRAAGVRRVGVLVYGNANDPDMRAILAAFGAALAKLGWCIRAPSIMAHIVRNSEPLLGRRLTARGPFDASILTNLCYPYQILLGPHCSA